VHAARFGDISIARLANRFRSDDGVADADCATAGQRPRRIATPAIVRYVFGRRMTHKDGLGLADDTEH